MTISVGTSKTIKDVVNKTNTASVVGSGLLEVFATPMMIALMEKAASEAIQPFLKDGETSVGTMVNIQHSMASPLGMDIEVTATVTEVDRRRVEFEVVATSPAGEIGKGNHTRFVVDSESFMKNALEQLNK